MSADLRYWKKCHVCSEMYMGAKSDIFCSRNCEFAMSEQQRVICEFEDQMGVGPIDATKLLRTEYGTYKFWKSGRNKMPGVAYMAIELLLKSES